MRVLAVHPSGLMYSRIFLRRMLFRFGSVYDPNLQLADHARPVRYRIALPPAPRARVAAADLYVHPGQGRRGREIDAPTERFVEATRMGAAPDPRAPP